MKQILLLAAAAALLTATSAWTLSGATLTVTGTGLKNDEGQLVIALFDSPDNYLEAPIDEKMVAIESTLEGVAVFDNLPPGKFVAVAFHDRNADGQLNTVMRLPRENYGFSNDARSLFGPPSFSKAAFEVGDKDLKIAFPIH